MRITHIVTMGLVWTLPSALSAQSTTRSLDWRKILDESYQLVWQDSQSIQEKILELNEGTGRELTNFLEDQAGATHALDAVASFTATTAETSSLPTDHYKHLAIGNLLLYLQDDNLEALTSAASYTKFLQARSRAFPEFAFWLNYIGAHKAILEDEPEAFVNHIHQIWFDVVLRLEDGYRSLETPFHESRFPGFAGALPAVYSCLFDLIVFRAISENWLEGIDSLGAVILLLDIRLRESAHPFSEWIRTVAERMQGERSDPFRLGFTVALLRADEAYASLEDSWTGAEPRDPSELFRSTMNLYGTALAWARTKKGQATATADQLKVLNNVLPRLGAQEDDSGLRSMDEDSLAAFRAGTTLRRAYQLYSLLSRLESDTWQRHGYSTQDEFRSSLKRLWQSAMYQPIVITDYYKRSATKPRSELDSARDSLTTYIRFFMEQVHLADRNSIPAGAVFFASEAALRLARIYQDEDPSLRTDEQIFLNLLQSLELFPLNVDAIDEIAAWSLRRGRPDLFSKHVKTPTIARLRQSRELSGERTVGLSINLATVREDIISYFDQVPVGEFEALDELRSKIRKTGLTRDALLANPYHPGHKLIRDLFFENRDRSSFRFETLAARRFLEE